MDATPSNSWPHLPPDVVTPGETLTLDDDGRALELRVLDRLPDDRFSALAPRLRVRAGLELTARVLRSRALLAPDVRDRGGRAGLRRRGAGPGRSAGGPGDGDERQARRAAAVLTGTVSPPAYEGYTFRTTIHTVDLSTTGVAFESDRSFADGERLDLSLEDETGSPITGSIEVVRTEQGPHGRMRVMCRFLEVDDATTSTWPSWWTTALRPEATAPLPRPTTRSSTAQRPSTTSSTASATSSSATRR